MAIINGETGEVIKGGRKKWVPPAFNVETPEQLNYLQAQEVVDQGKVGNVNDMIKTNLNDFKGKADKQVAASYAATPHPILKVQRCVVWLMKLEEMGMNGDIEALKVLLDRAFGKVTESLAVGFGDFTATKDGELLKELKNIRAGMKGGESGTMQTPQ